MQILHARQILEMELSEIPTLVEPKHTIVFDDGQQVVTTRKKTYYSRALWLPLRLYPKTPILSTYHVQRCPIIREGDKAAPLNKVNKWMLEPITKAIIQTNNLFYPKQKEPLLGCLYDAVDTIQRMFPKEARRYLLAIDVLDIMEVATHPRVKDAVENCPPTHEGISSAYKVVLDVIRNTPELKSNRLCQAVVSEAVNANQVLQCVGVRGFVTEVDGQILAVPVMSNYAYGMHTLYDYLAESLSAAKSLYLSEAPLQDAEFFARRLQLLTMPVERIEWSDCGSRAHVSWFVNPPVYDDNKNCVYPGDLAFMVGKYYLDEEKDCLVEITGGETHLYGKAIKIRSGLFCQTKDKHAICHVCFGAMSQNVTAYQNLGHLCSATMTQQTSQSVLSNKHVEASSVSANIVLSEPSRRFFTVNKQKNAYLVLPEVIQRGLKVVISRDQALGLVDLVQTEDINNISPLRVSSVTQIDVLHRHNGSEYIVPLETHHTGRAAILSMDFLRYLKQYGWKTDERGNYVFDFKNWDASKEFLKIPDKEYSYSNHSHQIARAIESSMENIANRSTTESPVATLQEVFRLVNSKLNVNIAALEVIIYALMIPHKDSCDLARGAASPVLGVANMLIKNRSLGAAYAFQSIQQVLTNPRSFFRLDRPDSPMDVFVDAGRVVERRVKKSAHLSN